MELKGYVYANDGLTLSIKAMHTQLALLNVHTDNIANFGIPGYQKKEAVVTSFAEYLGPEAVDSATNTDIGIQPATYRLSQLMVESSMTGTVPASETTSAIAEKMLMPPRVTMNDGMRR